MLTSDFDYVLPKELIAQVPANPRDAARLLVVDRTTGEFEDRSFREILEFVGPGDLLVLNDTRVIPARLYGTDGQGRRIELLLLKELEPGVWQALSRPSRKARPGIKLSYSRAWAEIVAWGEQGLRVVKFSTPDVLALLEQEGEVPLPPYIKEPPADPRQYQTVYAASPGAVAAPTAGLHFTQELLGQLAAQGVELAYLTLHAGLGTFRPVRAEVVEEHRMYQEELTVSESCAAVVNRALKASRRVIAVGTTVVRALETRAESDGTGGWQVKPGTGKTDLFIYPGYQFRVVQALLTNFHLPRSTLLMLVSALATREIILEAYRHAIEKRYRFYSFGDAMLIR